MLSIIPAPAPRRWRAAGSSPPTPTSVAAIQPAAVIEASHRYRHHVESGAGLIEYFLHGGSETGGRAQPAIARVGVEQRPAGVAISAPRRLVAVRGNNAPIFQPAADPVALQVERRQMVAGKAFS